MRPTDARTERAYGRIAATSFAFLSATSFAVNTLDLPATGPRLAKVAHGMQFLDLRFGYSGATASKFIADLGLAGRELCLRFYTSWDVAIPVLSWLAASASFAWLRQRRTVTAGVFLLPTAALLSDFGENAAIAALLSQYPNPNDTLAAVAGAITTVKWLAYGATVAVLLAQAAACALRRSRATATP